MTAQPGQPCPRSVGLDESPQVRAAECIASNGKTTGDSGLPHKGGI